MQNVTPQDMLFISVCVSLLFLFVLGGKQLRLQKQGIASDAGMGNIFIREILLMSGTVSSFIWMWIYLIFRPSLSGSVFSLLVLFSIFCLALAWADKCLLQKIRKASSDDSQTVTVDGEPVGVLSAQDILKLYRVTLFDLRSFYEQFSRFAVLFLKMFALSVFLFVLAAIAHLNSMTAEEFQLLLDNHNNELFYGLRKLIQITFSVSFAIVFAAFISEIMRLSFYTTFRRRWLESLTDPLLSVHRNAFRNKVSMLRN